MSRPAVIALVVILSLGLWRPGPCAHCQQPVKSACHQHHPSSKGHTSPLGHDSDSRDCTCPTHYACAVRPASSAVISPAFGTRVMRAAFVPRPNATAVLTGITENWLRGGGSPSPPGRLAPLYLTYRSLLI